MRGSSEADNLCFSHSRAPRPPGTIVHCPLMWDTSLEKMLHSTEGCSRFFLHYFELCKFQCERGVPQEFVGLLLSLQCLS